MSARLIFFPILMFVIAWGGFFTLFFLGPISYPYSPWIFILVLILFFSYVLGGLMSSVVVVYFGLRRAPKVYLESTRDDYISFAFWLALIYLAVVITDFVILGGVLEQGVTEFREMQTVSGRRGSMLGFLNVLLAGFPVLLVCYLLMSKKRGVFTNIAWLVALAGLGSYFLSGGRNQFAVSCVVIVLLIYIDNFLGYSRIKKFTILQKFLSFILLSISFFFMMYIFSERANLRDHDLLESALNLKYHFGVEFEENAFESNRLNDLYLVGLNLLFYANHSMSVLSEYFVDDIYAGIGNGSNTFPLFIMALDSFFGTTLYSEGVSRLILNGVYLSMPGRVYLDYGWYGVGMLGYLLGFIMNFLMNIIRRLRITGGDDRMLLSLLSVLAASVMLSPVYSIISGSGLSIVMSILILKILVFIKCKLVKLG